MSASRSAWIKAIERMGCPIGVPEREDRVIREARGRVDVLIQPAIFAGHVLIEVRRGEGVVHGRVEGLLFLLRAFDLDFAQFAVPFLPGFGANPVEIPMRQVGVEILQGVLRADGRDGDLHQNDFVLLRVVFGQESQIRPSRLRAALEADGAPFDLRPAAEPVAAIHHRFAVADDLVMIERPGVSARRNTDAAPSPSRAPDDNRSPSNCPRRGRATRRRPSATRASDR